MEIILSSSSIHFERIQLLIPSVSVIHHEEEIRLSWLGLNTYCAIRYKYMSLNSSGLTFLIGKIITYNIPIIFDLCLLFFLIYKFYNFPSRSSWSDLSTFSWSFQIECESEAKKGKKDVQEYFIISRQLLTRLWRGDGRRKSDKIHHRLSFDLSSHFRVAIIFPKLNL